MPRPSLDGEAVEPTVPAARMTVDEIARRVREIVQRQRELRGWTQEKSARMMDAEAHA